MKCLICGNKLENTLGGRKYCGHYKDINTCAGTVSKLQSKFVSMKERCTNEKHKNYPKYRYLGICETWSNDIMLFVRWAISSGWKPGLQIDRIENDKGYSPSNCRFVTPSQNCRNKIRSNTDWVKRERTCRVCRERKKFQDFMISRKEVGGIAYECRLCRKEMDRRRWINSKKLKQ